MLECAPLPFAQRAKLFKDGIQVVVPSQRRVPPDSLTPRAKTHNYLNLIVADQEVQSIDPEAWAVLLDVNGNLAEGLGSNIFIVRGDEVLTPREKFVLPGVSRQTVIDLAREEGLTCARPISTSTTPTMPTRCFSPRPRSASARSPRSTASPSARRGRSGDRSRGGSPMPIGTMSATTSSGSISNATSKERQRGPSRSRSWQSHPAQLANFASLPRSRSRHANSPELWHGTTILTVRKDGLVAVGGDGQVSIGQTIIKANAKKVRRLGKGDVIGGFAGATADAFTLFERLEAKLEQYPGQLMRAAVELAKDWRTDRYLRRLEAMMIVADKDVSLVLTGTGDVLEPEAGVIGIGSGGNYALAAARALVDGRSDAEAIVRKSLDIAADICVYTNRNVTIETLKAA